MEDLIPTLREGTALFGELGALLVAERGTLAGRDPAAVVAANERRRAVLEAILAWEQGAAALLAAVPESGGGPATLGQAVGSLAPDRRSEAEAALDGLRRAAAAAQHEAGVNHILVDRNLDTTERTLDLLTGRGRGLTYGPQGGVSRGTGGGLVAREG